MEPHCKPFSHGGRRLFELLEEPQEPFLLEVYLLEKNGGHSCNLLKSQQHSIKCWPTETCRRLLGYSSQGFKRRRGGRELACVLPKNWNFKLRKALNLENRAQARSGRFGRLLHSCEEVLDSRRRWKTMPDSKQLSPVSVFELHSDEGCSAHNHSMEEENTSSTSPVNPETADEESCYNQHKNDRNGKLRSNHLLQQCGKEFEERIFGRRESLGHHRVAKLAMEVQVVSFGAASIAEWIDVDRIGTTAEWSRFTAEAMEIGLVIEGFIFDEIREEVVVEMLGSHCFVQRYSF
ncbi:hypothetical protein KSP39_PZI021273 [Platanthera zijinensis]|uniref:DUF4378 domain-containing protein n=1 Tax=Platanthera zijinensis TaxID=2320716 RepID=A0AAP0FWA9_9ASPA